MVSDTPSESEGRTRRDFIQLIGVTSAVGSGLISATPVLADGNPEIIPFTYRAPQSALDDLRQRLQQARWPERATANDWSQGPPLEQLRALVEYWRTDYDWRRCESALAAWPQFRTSIDGLGIHFIHVRSRHPNALPIVLSHGWPSTVVLFRELIAPLTDPTAHGGTAADAFDVIIPSLPGFGFSDKPTERGWNAARTARAWGVLMQRLGYQRYVAQGGDWGAFVTTAMAQQPAPGLAAIHLSAPQTMPDVIPKDLMPDQARVVALLEKFRQESTAYSHVQATRPQTIGYALADSPVGQAAWIYDLFNLGTGQTGRPESAVSRDHILDEITLFWLTNTAASSARLYLEQVQLMGARKNPGRVDLPVAVSLFPDDTPSARSWAPLVYPRLLFWNELDRGGHFAQLEVPDLFTQEMRAFGRAVRA